MELTGEVMKRFILNTTMADFFQISDEMWLNCSNLISLLSLQNKNVYISLESS